ncbi:MAG: lamin tail domain-containing protein [Acidobacteria bacterium]|nr:lamin tail domain-containing protein [Acidobacteriota bacterium]MCA1637566.1 lamin tail domain-containing protein [Acidobacteriota bacterium]
MNKKLAFCALFIVAIFLSASFASQTYAAVVINEVYGGAGCGTAGCSIYNRDFVELYNNGTTNVDISGWTVQYSSATGTNYTIAATIPAGTILQPGDYYLIGLATGAAGTGVNTLTPDLIGTTALSATAGKVALVSSATVLSGASCPPTGATIIDFVGYGTANCFEGAGQAPAPSTTTSVQRFPNGTDTNNNNLDFVAAAPTPGSAGPTAASVSIEGRVMTIKGRGISRAQITLTDAEGNTRLAMSNSFGYYRFFDIAAGETYILSIRSKSHQFAEPTRVINVTEDLTGADFVAYW